MAMNAEQLRLKIVGWKRWGPYVSDRQWGTVREDYSSDGNAWLYTTHDMSRSYTYRWGEEGIAGISDEQQLLCFAVALWNKNDPIIKERYFGLTNEEGNHGEDVKELYYYIDSTPTHSYMKMLYKYPQGAFPYEWLVRENKKRNRLETEFELIDTGVFDEDKYFDIIVEYAKAKEDDILIKITAYNRGKEDAHLHILPTLWYRNTWSWGYNDYKPQLISSKEGNVRILHRSLGNYTLYVDKKAPLLFCENETNLQRLYHVSNLSPFVKDGINDYLINGKKEAINPNEGTKVAVNYELLVKGGGQEAIQLRLTASQHSKPFDDFETLFAVRKKEANEFYEEIQNGIITDDERLVQRQAYAGMLWSKQFYYFDVDQWLEGDPRQPIPPIERRNGRNQEWRHLNNADIISMPDKWEYPWYAAWDTAFHCLPFAVIDAQFAKQQLLLLTREWYMHPNGQLPAYEWDFSNVNPPVHAWATWRVYKIDQKNNKGHGDIAFLESVFHKLLLNFTWWVNRKDLYGNNIFHGGFLGLDNIGVFDRSTQVSAHCHFEQADATSWMAMFSINMMRISLELALHNPVYQDMATKFFEHFLYIAGAIVNISSDHGGLWDEEDQFFFDALRPQHGINTKLKVRSMIGLIPLFVVEVLDHDLLEALPEFRGRLQWFLDNRPHLASLVSRWQDENVVQKHLLSLLRGHRMKKILKRMLDEEEFYSEYGIRSLSKFHEQDPYELQLNGTKLSVAYTPGESTTGLFGGNSNWRGPIWLPMNFLIIESLRRFHCYYTDEFKVECPTGSGKYLTLNEIADEITRRLSRIFLRDENERRPVFGEQEKLQHDPYFHNCLLYYEYFHGNTGRGVGASHQTGWTGLIAKLLQPLRDPD